MIPWSGRGKDARFMDKSDCILQLDKMKLSLKNETRLPNSCLSGQFPMLKLLENGDLDI
jgi:hypothetical protein